MAIISTIGVSVTARTDKFRKGMKSAQSVLTSFAKSALRFGAVASAAAAAGLLVMTKRSLESIDAISKLSDSIGIATEDIVSLQFAARITGVSTQAMSKSLEQMTRRMGEAAGGTGEAFDALKLLGLSAKDLIRVSPAEAFSKIADAVNELGTQAEKADVAYGIFGRTGIKLLNTLALGSAGLSKMALTAKRLGITFTRDMGAKVEAANDAISRFKDSMSGLAIAFTVSVAPSIKTVADNLTNFVVTLRKAGVEILPVVAVTLKYTAALGAMALTITAINVAMRVWNRLTKAQITASTILKSIASPKGIAQLVAGLAVAGGVLFAIDKLFVRVAESANESARKIKETVTQMKELETVKDRLSGGGRFGIRKAQQFLGLTGVQAQEVARANVSPNSTLRREELKELQEQTRLMREMLRTGGLAS